MVGKSPAILNRFDQVARVAKTRATVLIEGEADVGKELVAAAVHAQSPRAARFFVEQDCGAVPENLLESELVDHKQGVFTGANEEKKGPFELAEGGTLFFDKVTEMPLLYQEAATSRHEGPRVAARAAPGLRDDPERSGRALREIMSPE